MDVRRRTEDEECRRRGVNDGVFDGKNVKIREKGKKIGSGGV